MDVKEIEIDKIDIIENSRMKLKDSNLHELMDSIKQHGLKHAIGVSTTKSNRYVLVFGNRRLAACKKLGYKTITASVMTELSHKDLLINNTIENLQRKDISPSELGRMCLELVKAGLTEREVAVRLSVAPTRVRTAMAIYKHLPEKIRDTVKFMQPGESKNGDIPASVAHSLLLARRRYNLTLKLYNTVLKEVKEHDLSSEDIKIVVMLIQSGMTPEQAVKNRNKYKAYRVDVVVDVSLIEPRAAEMGVSPVNLIAMAAYGLTDKIEKPSFISIRPAKVTVTKG
jgi:ParB/RepB/Spo0J family partition protein